MYVNFFVGIVSLCMHVRKRDSKSGEQVRCPKLESFPRVS